MVSVEKEGGREREGRSKIKWTPWQSFYTHADSYSPPPLPPSLPLDLGFRTPDIQQDGMTLVGCKRMGEEVKKAVVALM